jgi:uncharacterized protein (TIGR02444 family)
MNTASERETEAGRFWSFSAAFYEQPGVADALIALQDGAGADVNLILFALWHGLSGRGLLDQRGMAAADSAVHALREGVIEPLRALRRRLKSHGDPDIRGLRERIKILEIEAEKAAQHRLAQLAGAPAQADPLRQIDDAEANLAVCLAPTAASGLQAATVRRALRRFAENRLLSSPPAARPTA